MRQVTISLVAFLMGLVLVADTASAGIFARLRARQKAEIRAELMCELSAKLDQDLAREVDSLTHRLREEAAAQIAEEAEALEQQVRAEIKKLRAAASQVITQKARELEEQVGAEVMKLRVDAEEKVVAEGQKIAEQIKAAVNKLEEQAASEARNTRAAAKQISSRLEELETALQAGNKGDSSQSPGEKPNSAPASDETAAPSPSVELKDEK